MSLYGCPFSAFSGTVFTRWLLSRLDSRHRLDLGRYHRRWRNLWSQLHQSQSMLKQGESLIWCVMWNLGMRAVNCWWDNSLPLLTMPGADAVWMYMQTRVEGCEQVWSMKVWTVVAVHSGFVIVRRVRLSNLYTVTLVLASLCQSCNTLRLKSFIPPQNDHCCYGSSSVRPFLRLTSALVYGICHNWICVLLLRGIVTSVHNQQMTNTCHLTYLMLKVITSPHAVRYMYLIVWSCFTNIEAHKRPWSTLKWESCLVLRLSVAVPVYCCLLW